MEFDIHAIHKRNWKSDRNWTEQVQVKGTDLWVTSVAKLGFEPIQRKAEEIVGCGGERTDAQQDSR